MPLHFYTIPLIWIIALPMAYLAITTARSPQAAMAWVIFIVLAPPVGIPVYALFGYANFAKFERERRDNDAALGEGSIDPNIAHVEDRLAIFARLAGHEIDEGNAVTLLNQDETYDAIIDGILSAEHYVIAEYFIISDDETGRRFRDALVDRARAGCTVCLLHDEIPFFGLPERFWTPLREAGARIAHPQGPSHALGRFQLNYRNHRKVVVVDGQFGFTGGLNVGDKYANKTDLRWRDTFCRIDGPMVQQLQRTFLADWAWVVDDDLEDRLVVREDHPGDVRGVVIPIAPTDRLSTGALYFTALAHTAKRRLWLTTPYYAPTDEIVAALQLAALRGVEVRILVPDTADHYATYYAAYAFFDAVRHAGVNVYRYEPGFTHQKVAVVDDDVCAVGSVNCDARSGFLNFEVAAVMQSEDLVTRLETMLEEDFRQSRLIETDFGDQPAHVRFLAKIFRLAAPLL